MMEGKEKEAVAGTTTSIKEINQEFALLVLQQIHQIKRINIHSIDPLMLQALRHNIEAINMLTTTGRL